jgi:hypothetical protein
MKWFTGGDELCVIVASGIVKWSTANTHTQLPLCTSTHLARVAMSADESSVLVPVQTSIICTIGPKSKSVQMLTALLDSGMSVARLNFSHGDHAVSELVPLAPLTVFVPLATPTNACFSPNHNSLSVSRRSD